jgi:hypothetical protein
MSRLRSVFHGCGPFVGLSHFFVTGAVFGRTALFLWLACSPWNEYSLCYWFSNSVYSVVHGLVILISMSHFFVTGTVFGRMALLSMAMCFQGMNNNMLLVYE